MVRREDLESLSKRLKKKDKIIVTLNGTFDILHKGHEKIIKEAKEQGDVLIVGVNSDSSVKLNKGPSRPLNSELSRARILAAFDHVDYVTIFDEKTPLTLLEIIRPDVHVNGGDYGENCIEAETVKKHKGKIHIVKLIEGISTTKLIKKQQPLIKNDKVHNPLPDI
ncbi:adenylyltransferase/cytidyltransferase family protein [Candidatus Woesearchaeota archaeon]|nr:adenylyltransferase/cytidyltransferase family protein [Candidatus Woesearchaeota archaeon]